MRESGIAAQQFTFMHAHDAASKRVTHAVLDLVKPIQQRNFPLVDSFGGGLAPSREPDQRSF
jgi:hypothetical protein